MSRRGYYMASQPIVTGDVLNAPIVSGYELLARQQTNEGAPLTPSEFIARLSGNDLRALDGLALLYAIEQVVEPTNLNLTFNFNCSIRSLLDVNFIEFAADQLRALSDEQRSRLVLEITETERVEPRTVGGTWRLLQRNVNVFVDNGIRVAIDDFGCGHACLSLVRNLPVRIIKWSKTALDECHFAARKGSGYQDQMAIDLMHSIGHTMRGWGCDVIAEGIEHENQIQSALDLGANYFQGFLFGKPLTNGMTAPQANPTLAYKEGSH
jgi:EAL domain-containing protein (putative c-di-GMP-specific phosphodiesterase class I)